MGKKVLLAEDDGALRLMMKIVIQREGHAVTEAGDGEAALEKFAGERFDLAIIDIVMPKKEGIETILEIRRRDTRLPIIAISGGGRLRDRDPLELAMECGANLVMAKPFQPDDLRALLRRCLPET